MADAIEPMSPALQAQLRKHCAVGYQHYDKGDYKTAIRNFYSAWTLIPKPQTQWQESGWVLTALGDAYFKKADYQNSCEALNSALHCPDCEGNPFVHLRLGQSYYELNKLSLAKQHFQRVLDQQGEALFEQQDIKYLNSIRSPSNS